MILVAAITAAVDDVGTVTTLLFGAQDWTSGPADAPANTPCRGRLIEAGNFARSLGDGRDPVGVLRSSYGVAQIALAAGDIDAIARYGYGWRTYDLYTCGAEYDALPAFPGGWTQLLSATIESAEFDEETLTLRLRDRLALLDKPVCARFLGTGGTEGPAVLAGTPKPRVYGHACNARPVLIDQLNLIYEVSDLPYVHVRHMYDRRVALTPMSAAYSHATSFADLQALSVPAGQFARWTEGSMCKVGSTPAGIVTVDAIQMDGAMSSFYSQARFGAVAGRLASDAGLAPSAVSAGLTAIDAAGGAVMSLYLVDESVTYLDALATAAATRGAWVGASRLGVLQGAPIAAPSGPAAWTFDGSSAYAVRRITGAYAVPAKSATVRGGRNWTPMSSTDVASSVSTADREAVAKTYTYSERAAGNAAAKHLNAEDKTIDTSAALVNLISPSPPGAITGYAPSTWMALHGVERDTVEVTVPISAELLSAVDLGSVVQLRWQRYGYDAGRLMLVIGQRLAFAQGRAVYTLWG